MKKFVAILQLFTAALLFFVVAVTLINLVLITMRPETISVVNTLIGQGVISICLIAFGRILWRHGRAGLHAANAGSRAAASADGDAAEAASKQSDT